MCLFYIFNGNFDSSFSSLIDLFLPNLWANVFKWVSTYYGLLEYFFGSIQSTTTSIFTTNRTNFSLIPAYKFWKINWIHSHHYSNVSRQYNIILKIQQFYTAKLKICSFYATIQLRTFNKMRTFLESNKSTRSK